MEQEERNEREKRGGCERESKRWIKTEERIEECERGMGEERKKGGSENVQTV